MLLFWGKIEDWMFTWQRDWNDGCISTGRGVVSVWEEDPLEGDVDGLICNPLTCALFLTCTHNHCSAEQSMAQKHAALLPVQPTLLCSSQRPHPPTHTWTHCAFQCLARHFCAVVPVLQWSVGVHLHADLFLPCHKDLHIKATGMLVGTFWKQFLVFAIMWITSNWLLLDLLTDLELVVLFVFSS